MTTTIKVSDDLRDRLKAQAAREGLTLGAHLARLAAGEDRRLRLASLREAVAATPSDVATGYEDEADLWEQAEQADGAK